MPNEIAPAQMLRMNYPYPEPHLLISRRMYPTTGTGVLAWWMLRIMGGEPPTGSREVGQ